MAFAALAAAGIAAAGSIAGGVISQNANSAAGSAASGAGRIAAEQASNAANAAVARMSPWASSGISAANQINALLGLGNITQVGDQYGTQHVDSSNWQQNQKDAMAKFQTDPGYQFRLQQGVNALDRSSAARGVRLSGAQSKALSDYGQGTGSAEYGNYYNRLAALSSQGLDAAKGANQGYAQEFIPGNQAALGANLQQGQYNVAGANALASGIVGASKSISSGIMGAFGGGAGGAASSFA